MKGGTRKTLPPRRSRWYFLVFRASPRIKKLKARRALRMYGAERPRTGQGNVFSESVRGHGNCKIFIWSLRTCVFALAAKSDGGAGARDKIFWLADRLQRKGKYLRRDAL